MITFTVPGPPKPLQRARVGRMGAHARMYDPEANTTNKATVAILAQQKMRDYNMPLFEGPIRLELTFWVEKPKSKIRKNPNAFPWPTSKPDLDNCIKLICDALNAVVWRDDKQVVILRAVKRWCLNGQAPCTHILIQEAE